MPFIDVKLSCSLTKVQETALKAELGRAISLIPGKSESSLMIQFSDCCRLWFGGENEGPFAFVNVMVLVSADRKFYSDFTDQVIAVFKKELQIKRIYVKFEEVPNWFWD